MKNFLKQVGNVLALLLGCRVRKWVDEGLISYEGQGRDKYGN